MIDFPYLDEICIQTPSKILMLVVDGLGGLPHPETRKSEMETAHIPNLDALARESVCGLTTPITPGVTPGSGPGHLALFGYDPVKYLIGRGVLEALGIGIQLESSDVAVRGNFCTVDGQGLLVDRRAGRIPASESAPLCQRLDQIQVPGVELSVYPVQDYRFVLVLRQEGLEADVTETDPQRTGVPPLPVKALSSSSEKTAQATNAFVAAAAEILGDRDIANMVLLRGFSRLPSLPSMGEGYRLNPAAIAAYPMYRGLANLLGMKVIPTGRAFDDELETLAQNFADHDFVFLHYKPADAAGEDGNLEAKVEALEALDSFIPRILEHEPDVLVVAGDHATPALLAAHSWHPVPFLIRSKWTRGEGVEAFSERACALGSMGHIPAVNLMLLVLAQADKLTKFGP